MRKPLKVFLMTKTKLFRIAVRKARKGEISTTDALARRSRNPSRVEPRNTPNTRKESTEGSEQNADQPRNTPNTRKWEMVGDKALRKSSVKMLPKKQNFSG